HHAAAARLEETHGRRAYAAERHHARRGEPARPAARGGTLARSHGGDAGDGWRQEPPVHAQRDAGARGTAAECDVSHVAGADAHGERQSGRASDRGVPYPWQLNQGRSTSTWPEWARTSAWRSSGC